MCNKGLSGLRVEVVLLFCGIILAGAGCIPFQQKAESTPPVVIQEEEAETCRPDLKIVDYRREITRLKEVSKNHSERSERVKAHLHLACLYASYKNPDKDYIKALQHLNRYSALNPQAAKEYDVQNRLHLLSEIEQLSEKNVKLEKAIEDLQQAIEKLKLLDQQIEQKRERYR